MHGIRCRCLACRWQGRWHPESKMLADEPGGAERRTYTMVGRYLRELRCPRCTEKALRSVYWLVKYPSRAAAEVTYWRNLDRTLR